MTYLNYSRGAVKVQAEVESAAMEQALVKAYDCGIGELTEEERKLVQRFIDDAVLRIRGKL